MPKKIKGFNEAGEGKWFEGDRLPEGWVVDDPKAPKPDECPPCDSQVKPGDGDGKEENKEKKGFFG